MATPNYGMWSLFFDFVSVHLMYSTHFIPNLVMLCKFKDVHTYTYTHSHTHTHTNTHAIAWKWKGTDKKLVLRKKTAPVRSVHFFGPWPWDLSSATRRGVPASACRFRPVSADPRWCRSWWQLYYHRGSRAKTVSPFSSVSTVLFHFFCKWKLIVSYFLWGKYWNLFLASILTSRPTFD